MRFGSVCSGIEAASAAFVPLGWEAAFFSEIEPFPCAALAHHYPHVPNLGDMTKFSEWPDYAIDLLCGGTPCQSFSVAGLREGLADPRGNLMLTFGAIAARYRPKWLVWENVPGVLSSDGGRDFASFLGLITGQQVAVPAEGWNNAGVVGGIPDAYGVAYRVLDAQFFGVAQRRRRVFVVGHLGDWRRAAAVLLERHGLQGHPAPSREAREGTPAGTLRGTQGGSDVDHARAAHLIAGTLNANGFAVGSATQQDAECGLLVAHSLRGEGFDASEDGTGRGTPLVAVGCDGYNGSLTGSVAATLGARGSSETASGPTVMVAFDTTQITSATNRSNPGPGDPCHTLAKGAHAPAIAFGCQNSSSQGISASEHHSPTLDKSKTPAVAFNMHKSGNASSSLGISEDRTDCLRAFDKSPFAVHQPTAAVRRLTPMECERLQGFADHFTALPHRGKPAADGPRYKAIGNSWAVPVACWIGRRIEQVNAI